MIHNVLTIPSDITCILQKGLQPIHYAAQEGHEDVVMMLVDDFNVKPDAVNSVCNHVYDESIWLL